MTLNHPYPYLMPVAKRPNVVMARGQGSWLFDEGGKAYLDFVQGWAVNSLGHAPPELARALSEQAAQLLTPSPAFYTRPQLELSRSLAHAAKMDQVFLCNSGAEANDAAIKLARKWAKRNRPGAFEIITTQDSFHGRTLGTVAASGKPGWQDAFPPNLPGFVKVPFGDVTAVEQHISERTCAVMVEPIQGEAGVVVPASGYLRQLRQLCDRRGVLLILDEVQTGCGRTGTFLRSEAEAVVADILTLGKGLGGGVPIAALLARGTAACFELGDHGGTYAGNPLTAACALEVLSRVSSDEFLMHVRERGELLRAELERLERTGRVTCVRGAGLLWAAKLDSDVAERVVQECFELGLLVNAPRPNLLRLMPQLRVEPAEIARAAQLLEEALERTARDRD